MTRRLQDYFLRGPRLGLHFMLTGRALACLSATGRERRTAAGRSVLPLPPGSLAPSFDAPNIRDAGALGRLVREAVREAGGGGREASLLFPEACQKSFVLSFESLPPSAEERRELILWRLKKQAPSLPDDIRLSFDAAENGSPRRVFAAIARAAVVREYEDLFASCGIKLRSVGLPTLGLLNLLDRQREKDVLLANVEEESVSLLAVLDGRPALYRFKPFLAGKTLAAEDLAAAAAKEVSGTLRFLEDRENKTVKTVWVRSGAGGDASQLAAGLQAGTALPVCLLDPPVSLGLKPRERHFLGPLVGQAT
jgi:Tfp pilus assembly PilM family ATPase